jgi:outer membrane protein
MKKKITALLISMLWVSVSVAQTEWTLQQCLNYAIEHNIELKQQNLDVQNAEIEYNTAKNSWLPDLNVSAGQNFSFGRATLGDNISQPVNAAQTSISISTSMPLFTGFRITNQIKSSKFNLKAALEGLNRVKDNLQIQVVSLFLETLFKKEILKVYEEQIILTNKQVTKTDILVSSGKVPQSQLFEIKSQQARDELNVVVAKNDLSFSLLTLSQTLNLQINNFDIVEPYETEFVPEVTLLPIPDAIFRTAVQTKSTIKEHKYRLESAEKQLKAAQAGYYPTLSLGAGYGTSYQNIFRQENAAFTNQIRDYGSEYVGLSLNIPIFNRLQTRNQVRTAKLNIQNQSLVLDNVKLTFYKEIQQAYQSAVAAQQKFLSTQKATTAAEESFKYMQERYEIGKATVLELNEAKTKLLYSRSEQIQAKYDYIFRTKILDFYQGKNLEN